MVASLLLRAVCKQWCILLLRGWLSLPLLDFVVVLVRRNLWRFAHGLGIQVCEELLVHPQVLILCFVDVRLKHLTSIDDRRVVSVVRTVWIVYVRLATRSRADLAWTTVAYPHALTDLRRGSSRCLLRATNADTGSLHVDLTLRLLCTEEQGLLEVSQTLH